MLFLSNLVHYFVLRLPFWLLLGVVGNFSFRHNLKYICGESIRRLSSSIIQRSESRFLQVKVGAQHLGHYFKDSHGVVCLHALQFFDSVEAV
jgi:hypothetical protein